MYVAHCKRVNVYWSIVRDLGSYNECCIQFKGPKTTMRENLKLIIIPFFQFSLSRGPLKRDTFELCPF